MKFKEQGFTLIELIIGLLLSSLLGTLLYTTFAQSSRTLRMVEENAELGVGIVTVLHQLEKDLAGAMIPAHEPEEKKEQVEEKGATRPQQKPPEEKKEKKFFVAKLKNKQLDFLTFITTNPRSRHVSPAPSVLPQPSLVRVLYKIRENKEHQGSFVLLRQESTNLDLSSFEKKSERRPREIVVCNTVQKFDLQFLYRVQKEDDFETKTVTEWGASQEEAKEEKEKPPLLPQLIKINFELWDSQFQATRTIEYVMPVYVEAVADEAPQKNEEATAQETKKPEVAAMLQYQIPAQLPGPRPLPLGTFGRPKLVVGGGRLAERKRGLAGFFGG